MNGQLRRLLWLTLWVLLIGLPLFSHAAEAPGAMCRAQPNRHEITATINGTGAVSSGPRYA